MAIPSYDKFIEPILRYLAAHLEGGKASEVHDAAALGLGMTDDDKRVLFPTNSQPVYRNRAGWAHDRLKRAGLSTSARRGFWKITDKGLDLARKYPQPFSDEQVRILATEYGPLEPTTEDVAPVSEGAVERSPDDRLEEALAELNASTARDLLDAIAASSPAFFETLVLDLLHAMGYGASRADLQHVGRSGDGGIDGIIALDRLGLEKVFVQAKRWQGSVGRPPVQEFYGALHGRRATKGVIITTSTFTAQAEEFARSVEQVVLINGSRLTELMIEYGVGVSHRVVKIPKVDSDYFEES